MKKHTNSFFKRSLNIKWKSLKKKKVLITGCSAENSRVLSTMIFFSAKGEKSARSMVLFIPEEAFEAYLQGPSPVLKITTQSAVFLVPRRRVGRDCVGVLVSLNQRFGTWRGCLSELAPHLANQVQPVQVSHHWGCSSTCRDYFPFTQC